MTAGVQCDTCRRFAPGPPPGWLYLVRQPSSEPSILASLGIGPREEPGTFCSMRCVAEYAIVEAAAGEPATGSEPG